MFVLLKSTFEREATGDVLINADTISSFSIHTPDGIDKFLVVIEMQNGESYCGKFTSLDEAKECIKYILQAREKGVSVYVREGRYIDDMMAQITCCPIHDHEVDAPKLASH